MSGFATRLHTDLIGMGKSGLEVYKVLAPFIYVTDRGAEYTVPDGFLTDFASVPYGFHWYIHPAGRVKRAAVIHDWLYRDNKSQKEVADLVFWEAMGHCKMWPSRRWAAYQAVKWFGWRAYEGNDDPDVTIWY